jgi:DNA methylase
MPNRPYYEHAGITIYHGDAREILPQLVPASIITDPVWPNASKLLAGADNPTRLWGEAMRVLPKSVECLAVHLGVLSDPRFLRTVPKRLKFFRVCWLPMIPVSFWGRAVNGGDVAYIYGVPPGKGIIGGQCQDCGEQSLFPKHHGRNRGNKEYADAQARAPHPSPRKLAHVRWLVSRFAIGPICDPFTGTGTTLLAAKEMGITAIGIEIEERHCELAAKRLSQEVFNFA